MSLLFVLFFILILFPHPERETVYRSIFSTFAAAAAADDDDDDTTAAHIHFNPVEQEKLHDTFFSTLPSYNEYAATYTHIHSLLSRTSVFHDGLILGTQYRMCHIKRYIIFTPVTL